MADPQDDAEAQLLAAIREDPEDAQAREVYADWLDKRGDIRGEYVRLEMLYHSIPARLAQLAATLDPKWLDQLGRKYDVVLLEAGPNKIGVIKLVREHSGLGLKDAKDLVDGVERHPRVVEQVERDVARHIADAFRQVGAIARVAPAGGIATYVPPPRGVHVVLVAVKPEHRLPAMQLVREVLVCGMRDAFRMVDRVIAGTPETLIADATVDRARELVARFAPLGTVQCTPA